MTSTSKAYISCPLAITIKWCQMKDKDRCQHQWWSLYIYIYWRDVMKTIKSAHPPHFPFFRCFFHIKWNFNFQVKIQTTQQQQDKSKLKKLNYRQLPTKMTFLKKITKCINYAKILFKVPIKETKTASLT